MVTCDTISLLQAYAHPILNHDNFCRKVKNCRKAFTVWRESYYCSKSRRFAITIFELFSLTVYDEIFVLS